MLSFRVLPRSFLGTGTNAYLPESGPSRAPHPASLACTVYPACPEPLGELRGEPRSAASHSLIPLPGPVASSISFGINTCKSVSKQTTLTIFRINTYEKHRGVGALLLTRQTSAVGGSVSSASDRDGPGFLSYVPLRPRAHGARMLWNVVVTPHRETSPPVPVSKSMSRADAGCGNVILPSPGQVSCRKAAWPGKPPQGCGSLRAGKAGSVRLGQHALLEP
jgi:hypothetical protein